MPVIWCGGEDIDFPNGSLIDTTTSAGAFRSGYARCAIQASGAAGVMKSTSFPNGHEVSFWVSCYATTLGGAEVQGIGPGLAGKGIIFGVDTSNRIKLWLFNSVAPSLTQLDIEAGTSFTTAVLHRVDMQVSSWGVTANVKVYLDGVLKINYTGDLTFSGSVTSVDSIISRTGNAPLYTSEIIVANEDTRTYSLCTLAPNAAGDTDAWTGAYTDVNETAINDSNVISTDTLTQDEQFNLTDLPAGTFQILAVKEAARASITSGATATRLALGVKSGGSVNVSGLQTLATAWATFERLMPVNPVTLNQFTMAEINALQSNARSG